MITYRVYDRGSSYISHLMVSIKYHTMALYYAYIFYLTFNYIQTIVISYKSMNNELSIIC